MLLVHDANPAYTLPKATGFADRDPKGRLQGLHLACTWTRPRALCDLVLPQHHALERWDDSGPGPGVYSLMQPVMEPVFDTLPRGRHPAPDGKESGRRAGPLHAPSCQAHLQARWQALATERTGGDAAAFWHAALQRGGVFSEPRRADRRSRSPPAAAQVRYTRPSVRGKRRLRLPDLSPRAAARRPRRQQALAAGERRPGHQDHLALLGRGGPATARPAGRARR